MTSFTLLHTHFCVNIFNLIAADDDATTKYPMIHVTNLQINYYFFKE